MQNMQTCLRYISYAKQCQAALSAIFALNAKSFAKQYALIWRYSAKQYAKHQYAIHMK
jgi:hypothetical protein